MPDAIPVPGPRLLILAGGLGRRFGSPKQVAPVGPGGAWLMDYTVVDALRNGFDHVVCVVRPEIRSVVRAHLTSLVGARAGVTVVDQTLDAALPPGVAVPEGRRLPWGTAHALLVAEAALPGPFAVVNADDVYGGGSIACLARALREDPDSGCLVAYALGETLSPHGPVNRGLCRSDEGGWLRSVLEVVGVEVGPEGRLAGTAAGRPVALAADDPVSMNLWGLGAEVFPILRRAFRRFLSSPRSGGDAELALPDVVGEAVAAGDLRMRLLPCGRGWIGMTHASDRTAVQRALAERGPPGWG